MFVYSCRKSLSLRDYNRVVACAICYYEEWKSCVNYLQEDQYLNAIHLGPKALTLAQSRTCQGMFTAAADTWTWFFASTFDQFFAHCSNFSDCYSFRNEVIVFSVRTMKTRIRFDHSWVMCRRTLAWNIARRQCWNRAFCDGGIISTFWFLWQKIVFRTWLIDEACPPPYIWMNSSSNASNLASICRGWNGLSSSSTMHCVTRGEHFFHAEKHILLERPFMADVESHPLRVMKRGRAALCWTPRAHASSLILVTRCVFPIP